MLNKILIYIGFIVCAYLIGNISFARIISKIANRNKKDVTSEGSGNPGSMNMLRSHGAGLGLLTLLLDGIKGAAPALVAYLIMGGKANPVESLVALYATGLAAVLGHIFPVFYKFKGGKGIATTVGVFFVGDPLISGIIFVGCFIFFYLVKIGSLTSILYIFAFAIVQSCLSDVNCYWLVLVLIWSIIAIDTWAHRYNIIRMFNLQERQTSFKEGLLKDIQKLKEKRQRKLENIQQEESQIEEKYEEKFEEVNKEENPEEHSKLKEEYDKEIQKIDVKESKIKKWFDKKLRKTEKKADKIIKKYEIMEQKASYIEENKNPNFK